MGVSCIEPDMVEQMSLAALGVWLCGGKFGDKCGVFF
jgi:hypothetical protein